MIINYNGEETNIEIIGGFKIEELNKEYAMCAINDDPTNKTVKIVILELIEENGEKKLVDIAKEDTEMILLFYNSLKSEVLKGGKKNE